MSTLVVGSHHQLPATACGERPNGQSVSFKLTFWRVPADPEFLESFDDGPGSFHLDQDLVVDIGTLDEPAAGIQTRKDAAICLLEPKPGSDQGIAGEKFIDSAQEVVEADSLSCGNA